MRQHRAEKLITLIGIMVLGVHTSSATTEPSGAVAIRGARIITVDQGVIENGTIVIEGTKITAVGRDLRLPAGTRVVDAAGLTAMPGIVDAEGIANGYSEAVRYLRPGDDLGTMRAQLIAGDFFDPYGTDYRQERTLRDLVAWGVTAVNVKLTDRYVFDGTSSLVKIHAPPNYENHFVKYRSALRVNLGERPRSEGNTFPTTRMGIVGLVRQQFIEALAYQKSREQTAADQPVETPPRDLKMEALVVALEGEIPVIMHAVEPMDIETALRIAEEFNLRLVLSASTQALEAQAAELAKRQVPVILGTYFASINSHTGEQTEFRYETAAMLVRHGVKVAFGGLEGETKFLLINAGIAVQHGMPHSEAIKALTLHPAQILGVENRLGTLTVGKDADIVLYRGDPLQISSPVEKAFINGRLVYERQPFNATYHNLQY